MKAASEAVSSADNEDLRRRAVHGTVAIGLAQVVKFATQLLSVVILARLLAPTDFGLFAMVMPLAAFVMMVQDIGLSQAVVASPHLTPAQTSAMFWINAALSLALALLFAIAAPLIAAFFGEPRLVAPALALAGSVLVSGLATQHFAHLTKTLRFGTIAVIDIASTLLGFAAAVAIAWFAPGIWALVASVLVGMGVGLVGAWATARWLPGRPARFAEVRELLRLGAGLSTFTLSNFFARNLDNVMIGRWAGAVQLGFYDRAYKLLLFPLQQINNPIGRVMVPVLSRLADEPHRYRHAYRRTIRLMLMVTLPGVAFMLVFAAPLIDALMGPRWRPAAAIFTWLAVAALHQPMSATFGWLFISQRRGGEFGRWGLFNMVTSVLAFAIGLPWGAIGVAAAYALSDVLIRMPVLWWWVGRSGPVRHRDLLSIVWPFAIALAGTLAGLAGLRLWGGATGLAGLVLAAGLAFGSFAVLLAFTAPGRETLAEAAALVGSRLGRFGSPERRDRGSGRPAIESR
ncbi:polysaccharide biosynthesis protein [Rhizorhabdus wittichii RW1]|uniref:Polysaccharide biosynthesis protein n=1 Tax=Rhizorhabdus wittichii (strain DSM 6014 / CCUG 31198 / JCM 15750 / NBRC 105917 / EY 4224 / RW1) TaxID=392499 RepID=A0A9J9LG94_RHIWR|nr:polysaccharide biosynthesis protein [Rhizorhabdus wittichii RW1]